MYGVLFLVNRNITICITDRIRRLGLRNFRAGIIRPPHGIKNPPRQGGKAAARIGNPEKRKQQRVGSATCGPLRNFASGGQSWSPKSGSFLGRGEIHTWSEQSPNLRFVGGLLIAAPTRGLVKQHCFSFGGCERNGMNFDDA